VNNSTSVERQQGSRPHSRWLGYAAAVVAVGVATLVRLVLDPALGDNYPFATYFGAVAVVAWGGRTRPSVAALVLSGFVSLYLFLPPRYTLGPTEPGVLVGLALFFAVGVVMVAMGHAMRVARNRAERLLAEAVVSQDELRRAVGAEAEQRERLRTTLASIGDAVITTDRDGNVTYLNAVAEALTGWTNGEAAGAPLPRVFHIVNESTRRPVENPAIRALSEGVIVGLANHTVLISKDGTERPIDDSAAPIRRTDGEIVGGVLVFRDITDRHAAERSLRESEERAAFVRRAGGVGFWYCDLPFDVLQWDELVKAHFHLPPDAPVTIDTFYARIHPDDREPTRRAIERSIDARTGYDTEYRTVCPDTGAVKWVRAIGRTFYAADGTPTRFDGVTLDVTEQKRAEERLRASEERYRTLFESMDEGFCVIEFLDGPHGPLSDYVHVAANPAFTANAGIPDIVGQKVRELVPDEAGAWVEVYRNVLATGRPVRFERELAATGRYLDLAAFRIEPPERRQVAVLFTDVTARKRAEERLRASEERLRTALSAARMVAWEWTPADGRLHVSENAADVFGLPAGVGLTGIEQGVALLHPDDAAAYRATFRTAIDERGSYLTHYRLVRPADGRVIWIEERGHAVSDRPGGNVRLFGVAADVTDRVRAEERLRASEEQLRLAVGAAKLGLWSLELRTLEMTCSDGCKENYGRRPGDPFTYADLWEAVHPDDRERVREAVRRAVDTRTDYDTEYRTRWPDGSVHSALVRGRATYARDGTPLVMTGVSLDITDRRRAEQVSRFVAGVSAALADLTDSASTFHKVAALSVPTFADWCAVDIVDEDGRPRRVAVAHADPDKIREFTALLAKYPPRAGDPHGVLKVIRTGESELVEEVTDATLASATHDEDHFRRLKALGLRSHVLAPLRSHGRVLGVVTFITAESGRLYTAADLVVAEDLAGRAAVAVENARLYQALQEADRRKDEFLATLAHELRNPLAPIRNAAQVFRLKAGSDPDLQRGRDVIDRQVDHLTRLIDDLLDVSRIARNKLELRKAQVVLADAVAGAVETSRPLIEQMGHDLAVELPPEPVYLDADLIRLSQVFMNLLTNAAKYTPEGGRIRLTARRDGGDVVVAVTDTGLGIPAEKLPSLFEMFFQVDGTLEKSQGGLGIGLSLVRRLVEMHGGTVGASSPGANRGSEFTVRLPVLDWRPGPPPAAEPPAGRPLRGATRRVLVVDDNRDAAETLAMLMEVTGHEVRTAHDGEAGVAAAGEFRPDVILMDIGMPKLNGYEAARRIREQPWGQGVLLVALTGWGQDDDRRRSDAAGFDAHLVKPVDHAALTKLLDLRERA
jgi:PAS domain S-box-containing protein